MNVIYLLTVLLISFIYINSNILRNNNKIIAIIIFFSCIVLINYTELFYLLLGLSIIIFFSKNKRKEKFNNYKEYGFEKNIGEQLIKDMYEDVEFYPKILNKVSTDNILIKDNTIIDGKYKNKSNKIIRDDKYLVKNLQNQINKYGDQNNLNDQMYNSEYDIYSFQNDQPLDQVNTDEWWNRYNQLKGNKDGIQQKLDDNSSQIIDLENDNKIITQNLEKNKKQLQKLRDNLDKNIDTIDENQKCLSYGVDTITKKYIIPKKQNLYYGEINAPQNNIYPEIKVSIDNILKAYKKDPETIAKCVEEINGNNEPTNEDNGQYNSCKKKVEFKPVYLPSNNI